MPGIIPKGNGIRLCVEIGCSNKAVFLLRHPSPTIEDILMSVQGSPSFNKLGLRSGFHQPDQSLDSHSIATFQIKKKK